MTEAGTPSINESQSLPPLVSSESSANVTTSAFPVTTFRDYYIPRRAKVVPMSEMSQEMKDKLFIQYFQSYDHMTGARIAATLGTIIAVFTIFLIYKSKCKPKKKKPEPVVVSSSIYDSSSVNNSSSESSSSSPNDKPDDTLREIVVCQQTISVKDNHIDTEIKNPTILKIVEDASHSLPCSPYADKKVHSEEKRRKNSTPTDSSASTDSSENIKERHQSIRRAKVRCKKRKSDSEHHHHHHHHNHNRKKSQFDVVCDVKTTTSSSSAQGMRRARAPSCVGQHSMLWARKEQRVKERLYFLNSAVTQL